MVSLVYHFCCLDKDVSSTIVVDVEACESRPLLGAKALVGN